ncbi:hypothetical protein [uncultured Mesonia sp.]|uniref:hypothetical protein n=1 Tax=uncultured Mesonia sp. TaxID=399731 RepID=UPI00374F971B
MTFEKIIIILGLLIGIFLFKKTKPDYLKAILIGLILVFVLTFFPQKLPTNISFYSFGLLTFIFTILSGLKKKWFNLIIGFFAFISFVSAALEFPYANELKLLMIIPIISYFWTLKKLIIYKNALSISTILVAYELTEFLKMTIKWFSG